MSGSRIALGDDGRSVAALLDAPPGARAAYVFGHGAGAGMEHAFMAAAARGLAERGIAVLRYQFPFMDARSRRPDLPALAQATVRAAVAHAAQALPGLPLVAGGKSYGGRMTSQAQAAAPLDGVAGLVFFGFPLHPANKPATARAAHLAGVRVPMLFVQGTRDALADAALLGAEVARLGTHATLHWEDGADHAFHVPAKSGRDDADVLTGMLDAAVAWIEATTATIRRTP